MKVQHISLLVVALGLPVLLPVAASADAASDQRAEIQRKKEEALKRAEDRRNAAKKAAEDKAAADKKAADKKAADDKAAADKAAADKAAADKAAADKAAADKKGAGGTSGTGGATGSSSGGGTGGTKAAGGAGGTNAGGTGAGGKSTKAAIDEKDAPLPAVDIDTLRKDRVDRRKATVERLRRRWGRVLAEANGAADLKLHGRRVALLQRIRLVAEGKKDKKTIEAVDDVLTKEDDRHSKAMNALREGALRAGAPK